MMRSVWSNWSGSVRCEPAETVQPASEAEVVDAVRGAQSRGMGLRVAGAGHSFSALVATDGMLLDLGGLAGIVSIDAGARRAVVRAGTRISALGEPLFLAGLALENQGDVDVQTLAGAIATGTHGTGRKLGCLSTQVERLRLVIGSGEVVDCSASETPELFDAVRLSLGALGVVTEIELRLVPAYRLHQKSWRVGFDEGLEHIDELALSHRHFELFWWPLRDRLEMKTLDPTAAGAGSVEGKRWERIDFSHRVFPTLRELRFNEIEYTVPERSGIACLSELRDMLRVRHPGLEWPVEYRTVAGDDLYLSPCYARGGVAISVHQAAEIDPGELFADAEAIFRAHDGRPHWGKRHGLGARELEPLYPRWREFQRVRAALDPGRVFSNAHIRAVLGD